MTTRRLTLLCFSAIMLTAASAHAQLSPSTAPGASPRGTVGGTVGLNADRPGTNSLGTAQSSGRGGGGQGAASVADDPALKDEDRKVDHTVKSTICRGC